MDIRELLKKNDSVKSNVALCILESGVLAPKLNLDPEVLEKMDIEKVKILTEKCVELREYIEKEVKAHE